VLTPDPSVTVVVATHEGEAWIGRCLESLLAQRGETVEIVVVDDGSLDRTADVVATYPVRLVREPHRGVASARNTGVRLARSALVGFCDQDDEWHPDKARRQAAHLREHPTVAMVLCRQEAELGGTAPPSWLVPDANGDLGGVLPLSGLFRATALHAVGGFDERLAGNDDLDRWSDCGSTASPAPSSTRC
jgi:glycosyltransferase involved in cell wall biosynthesis